MEQKSGYSEFVDYGLMGDFKKMMVEVGRETRDFSKRRGVDVFYGNRSVYWNYFEQQPHYFRGPLLEGLGNKSWIAEWMYKYGDHMPHYNTLAQDLAMMGVGDSLPFLPFAYSNEVTPRKSDWFADEERAADYARGTYDVCKLCSMTLVGGESPNYRFLVKADEPVDDAPVMSCAVNSILVNPQLNAITADRLKSGLSIVAARSSGLHSNGISLVIDRAMKLPDKFLTLLPNGNTLGAEALIPTMCYVGLVEAIQEAEIELAGLLPATGSGVGKLADDHRNLTYHVLSWWQELPPLMQFMLDIGVDAYTCATTFNMGAGMYFFVKRNLVDRLIGIGTSAGYDMLEVGRIEEGTRRTAVGTKPLGFLDLPPPAE
ncbi:MAG: hypothetical protein NTZ65_00275 [Candidatus Berkelbacteria bacterium]|nr:hypothetical protein [Candidatus Berkelbacteria bacterium]